jgi:uncharacterized protein with GYD domain
LPLFTNVVEGVFSELRARLESVASFSWWKKGRTRPRKRRRKEEDRAMPLYMTQFAYTSEAWATLTDNPEDRSVVVRELLEAQGGRLIGWYLSFGEYDGLVIYEAPDDATAGAVVLAAARHGHLRATKTTPLFTSEESMGMMRRAGTTAFRAPRQLS